MQPGDLLLRVETLVPELLIVLPRGPWQFTVVPTDLGVLVAGSTGRSEPIALVTVR